MQLHLAVCLAQNTVNQDSKPRATNACGNGDFTPYALTEDVFCSNTGSQIQGDENGVGLSSSQR